MSLTQDGNSTFLQFSVTPSLSFNKPDIYLSGLAAISILFLVLFVNGYNGDVDGFPLKRGIPFIGSWAFFTSRELFISDGLRRLGNTFIFKLIHVSLPQSLTTKSNQDHLQNSIKYLSLVVKVLVALIFSTKSSAY